MKKRKKLSRGTPTPREKDILAAIRLYQKNNKRPPTFEELGEAIGMAKVTAVGHCRRLQDKGLVTWDKWKSRTLRIL